MCGRRPERMIDVMVGRQPPGEEELVDEVAWIAERLAMRIIAEKRTTAERGEEQALAEDIRSSVLYVLEQLQDPEDPREVPFIWTYRKDYLHEVITCADLWFVQSMDEKWESLVDRRTRLSQELKFIEDASRRDESDSARTRAEEKVLPSLCLFSSLKYSALISLCLPVPCLGVSVSSLARSGSRLCRTSRRKERCVAENWRPLSSLCTPPQTSTKTTTRTTSA